MEVFQVRDGTDDGENVISMYGTLLLKLFVDHTINFTKKVTIFLMFHPTTYAIRSNTLTLRFQSSIHSPTYYLSRQFLVGEYHMKQTGIVLHMSMNTKHTAREEELRGGSSTTL